MLPRFGHISIPIPSVPLNCFKPDVTGETDISYISSACWLSICSPRFQTTGSGYGIPSHYISLYQKGGIDVSSHPSRWATRGHRPAAKYSTVVGFDLQAPGPLRCSESFFGALFAFRYFTKKGFVFGWASTFFAADLGSFFFFFFFNRQHGSGIRKVVTNIK